MKIRLLENPGYAGMDLVVFPVEVEAETKGQKAYVPSTVLASIGADYTAFSSLPRYCWPVGSWEKAE